MVVPRQTRLLGDPLGGWWHRASMALLSYFYLIILSQSIKTKKKRVREFDYNLDDLGMSTNVFQNALLMYGYSVELIAKFMFLYKTNDIQKTIGWNHKIDELIIDIANRYNNRKLLIYKKILTDYREWIEWIGKYPVKKSGTPNSKITDLLSLQNKTQDLWVDLLDTFENNLENNQEKKEYLTLRNFYLPIKYHNIRSNKDFVEKVGMVALERIISVGNNFRS